MLPSSAGGPVTQTVGFIHAPADTVAPWLLDGMKGWRMQRVHWRSLEDAVAVMGPARQMDRNAVVPVAGWSLLFRNSPLGNDVGVIPSLAARQLGCLALRAVCVPDGEDVYPARMLEVYDTDGTPPLLERRSVAAANDGGSWVFETSGEPYAFEDLDAYKRRRKTERFPPELLYAYLGHLGVPYDTEPDWEGTQLLVRG